MLLRLLGFAIAAALCSARTYNPLLAPLTDRPEHPRVLIANERKDRLALVAPIAAALGHEVIAREIEVEDVGPGSGSCSRAMTGAGVLAHDLVDQVERTPLTPCPKRSSPPATPTAAYRIEAAERRVDAEGERQEELSAQEVGRRRDEAAARHASDERVRARLQRRRERARAGLRRYRPGPGSLPTGRGPAATTPSPEQALDNEIQAIRRALDERGSTERRELVELVGARYCGPGAFPTALRNAIADGDIRHTSRSTYEAVTDADSSTEDRTRQGRAAGTSHIASTG